MRNVLAIAKEDFKKLFSNTIGFVVTLGLIFMPSMYAWFNIAGSWDPYGNTGQLKVAVANNDQGYSSDALPIDIYVGDSTMNQLRENAQFQWVFVSEEEAIEGVKEGTYYSAIVIPETFSDDLLSFISGSGTVASLTYYTNEKVSAIAPKVTNKGANAVQHKISTAFAETVVETILRLASTGVDVVQPDAVAGFANTLKEGADSASSSISDLATSLRSINAVIESSKSLATAIKSMSPGEESLRLMSLLDKLRNRVLEARQGFTQIKEALEEIEAPQELRDAIDTLLDDIDAIQTANDQAYVIAQTTSEAFISVKSTMSAVETQIDDLSANLVTAADKMDESAAQLKDFSERVQDYLDNETLDTLKDISGDNPSSLAELLVQPVNLQRVAVYSVENNGSSMTPFYTALSIWVGATLLVALMKTEVSRERCERMEQETGRKVRLWELYLGRYIIFAAISLLQTTVIILGNIVFLGVQCAHPFLFMLTGWAISAIFSLFIYTLVASFGSIGKALAIILLVMQVAGSGGTFPIQMMGQFFQDVYPFLPFKYAIAIFQECIAGLYEYDLVQSLINLATLVVPASLLLGMVLRAPMVRVNAWLAKKLEETGVMG